jgi:putative sterol carrier protein
VGERFGTPDWAQALCDQINASSEYRNAAAAWGVGFNGDVVLVFEADTALPATRSLLVRLAGGACQAAEFHDGPQPPEAGFILRAPFSLWKDILERRTLAATALLTGRLKLTGDTATLLRHLAAHRALVHCAASLDTDFS